MQITFWMMSTALYFGINHVTETTKTVSFAPWEQHLVNLYTESITTF